jgi:hypothetical protein
MSRSVDDDAAGMSAVLPIDVMAGGSTAMSLLVVALLFVWTRWYGNRMADG